MSQNNSKKNKTKSSTSQKIFLASFILLVLAGLFGPMGKVEAQITAPSMTLSEETPETETPSSTGSITAPAMTLSPGSTTPADTGTGITAPTIAGGAGETSATVAASTPLELNKSGLYENLSCFDMSGLNVAECLGKLFYIILISIPAFILGIAGMFFNAMLAIGLNGDLFNADFVSTAWVVVRDLSNIFFILILLYIAIQTILGLGHETKKMIIHVIIMALLINFSLFSTKVVIDSSNILALVFYNKITSVGRTVPTTNLLEKDLSSGLAAAFNPSKLISGPFLENLKTKTQVSPPTPSGMIISRLLGLDAFYYGTKLIGYVSPEKHVPIELTMGIEVVSGTIMLYAAYCFFIVGLVFLTRLIELWLLMIFSPFAFMSWSIPKLSGIAGIGWEAWLKRLLTLSFIGPIFMFFLYLIFKLIDANLFSGLRLPSENTWETIMFFIIPALVILIILHKATSYAKKTSGELGEAVMKYGKMVGGLALGAAAATASGGASLTVGGLASKAASSKLLQEGAKKTGWRGVTSRMALRTADYGSKASFDVRAIPGVGKLAGAGGLDLGKAREGGFSAIQKRQMEKRQKRADELVELETKKEKRAVEMSELKLKAVPVSVKLDLEDADKEIEKMTKEFKEAKIAGDEAGMSEAKAKLQTARENKKRVKEKGFEMKDETGKTVTVTIKQLEDEVKTTKHNLEKESGNSRIRIAERLEGASAFGRIVARAQGFGNKQRAETSLRIRARAKIESSGKSKDEDDEDDEDHGGGGGGHAPVVSGGKIKPKGGPGGYGAGGGGGPAPAPSGTPHSP